MLFAMRLFARSVEAGSFSKAAASHNLKPSSVSRHISSLETELGTALFRRSTRQIVLTDAGLAFYDRTIRILADVDDARRSAANDSADPVGILRLVAPIEFGRLHLTPLLAEFTTEAPGLSIDVQLTDEVDLQAGRFDLSIGFGEPADSRYYSQKLARNGYSICCAPAYLERASRPQYPSSLRDYNCLVHADNGSWQFGSRRSTVEIAVAVSGNFISNRAEAILHAALAGAGFARLPHWLAGPHLTSGALVAVMKSYEVKFADDAIHGLYPEKRSNSPKMRAFLAFLMKKWANPPLWEPMSVTQ